MPRRDGNPTYPEPPDDWLGHDWATPLVGAEVAADMTAWERNEVRRSASNLDRALRDVIASCATMLETLQEGPESKMSHRLGDTAFHNTTGDLAKAAFASATLQRTLDGVVHRRAVDRHRETGSLEATDA